MYSLGIPFLRLYIYVYVYTYLRLLELRTKTCLNGKTLTPRRIVRFYFCFLIYLKEEEFMWVELNLDFQHFNS